ncbi:hypothetical protein BpHYR1_004819 [Brachionus plicatilis]|uniref:Uncharacterized protein n=1 Tax=Brachionus plicatilis TaxID=10195 RepID=A0A3M7SSR1_BRAPC|nr:hypothetical protein BpHYR1_004819 [Brachionus plicatilis]
MSQIENENQCSIIYDMSLLPGFRLYYIEDTYTIFGNIKFSINEWKYHRSKKLNNVYFADIKCNALNNIHIYYRFFRKKSPIDLKFVSAPRLK